MQLVFVASRKGVDYYFVFSLNAVHHYKEVGSRAPPGPLAGWKISRQPYTVIIIVGFIRIERLL